MNGTTIDGVSIAEGLVDRDKRALEEAQRQADEACALAGPSYDRWSAEHEAGSVECGACPRPHWRAAFEDPAALAWEACRQLEKAQRQLRSAEGALAVERRHAGIEPP